MLSSRLKSKRNKQRLASILHSFELDTNVTMESCENCSFGHDEADITMISCVLEAANNGKGVVHVLSGDSDAFVSLVYWVYWRTCSAKYKWKVGMGQF